MRQLIEDKGISLDKEVEQLYILKMERGKMKNTISIVLLVAVFMVLTSYGKQNPQWKGTIEEENGVKVIKNPNEPLYGEITFDLEEDLIIGNEEDKNYMFYKAQIPAVDSEGNILVLDSGNYRIQKYDKNGKYLQTIGRQGQGPGEFERPFILYLDADDNIYVYDMGRRNIQKFEKNGNFISSTPSEMPKEFGIIKNGNYIANTVSFAFFNIDLISQKGTTIKTIASFPSVRNERIKTDRGGYLSLNNLCNPSLVLCSINEDLAIYGYSTEYSLFAINAKGRTVYIIKKDESPQPVTREEKYKVIDRIMGIPGNISRKQVAGTIRFPKHKPFYERIIKDNKDRIYVEKFKFIFDQGDNTDFDIFNKDGYYLYKAKIPPQYPVIRSGYIYTTEYDQDTGYAKIKRYRIRNWEQIREGVR